VDGEKNAPNTSALSQLRSEQAEITRTIRRITGQATWRGVVLAISLELLANFPNVAAWLKAPAQKLPDEWHLTAGIGTADAVVIVTALVLLVATLNVALAAFFIKDRSTIARSVVAMSWAEIATTAGTLAATVSVALTITRLPESPALAVIAAVLTSVTILLTGSIPNVKSRMQLELNDVRWDEQIQELTNSLTSFQLRDRSASNQKGITRSAEGWWLLFIGRYLLLVVIPAVLNTALVVVLDINWARAMNQDPPLTPGDWALGLFYKYTPALIVFLFLYGVFVTLRIGELYSVSRGWGVRAWVCRVLFLAVAIALPIWGWIVSSPESVVEWSALSVLVLLPQVVVLLWSSIGPTDRVGPRYSFRSVIRASLENQRAEVNRLRLRNANELSALDQLETEEPKISRQWGILQRANRTSQPQ